MTADPVRLNKFIAQTTDFSRRAADTAISEGRVTVNSKPAEPGQMITATDKVTIDDQQVVQLAKKDIVTVIFNKPRGYVCSRNGQGSRTIYELLPPELQNLNSVGRLDKESSGLLLLTNDGELANNLTHPRYQKTKIYEVSLDKPLLPLHHQMISDYGIRLEDGVSKLQIEKPNGSAKELLITMHEGRNRQIRRTFSSLGYEVTRLHRLVFGNYHLGDLKIGEFEQTEA